MGQMYFDRRRELCALDERPLHHLMDYNHDATTRLADVQSLFAEAIARVK